MLSVKTQEEFYRIEKLPPYVFAVINEMKAKARAAQLDVVDLGMGNPDGATPRAVVNKLVEAARNPRNHRYSMSRGIPQLRDEIVKRYKAHYGVDLDPEKEAIVTIGAKDALAHLLFAVIGPGDVVVSPNPAYPIHQYGVIMAEGHACMLPMPDPATFLNSLEDLYRTSAETQDDSDLLSAQPHHPVRGSRFLSQSVRAGGTSRHHSSSTISPMPTSASTATRRPAFCRWTAPKKSPSRFSRSRKATTWPDGAWASASATGS